MHVARLASDEGFVHFDSAATGDTNLQHRAILHGLADTMEHEPCRFLSDAQSAGKFTGTNTVFCGANDPDGRKPFLQSKRRILKDGSDLRGELAFRMCALALPFLLVGKPRHISPSASGASDAIGPSVRDHIGNTVVGVCEEDYGLLKSLRRFHLFRVANLC